VSGRGRGKEGSSLFEEGNTVSNNKSLSPMRPWWALITLVIVYSTGVRVALSLVLCVVFCRSFIVFFSFGHCVVCPSSIYGFWLPPLVSSNSSYNECIIILDKRGIFLTGNAHAHTLNGNLHKIM